MSPKSGLEFSNNWLKKSRRPTQNVTCLQSPLSVRLAAPRAAKRSEATVLPPLTSGGVSGVPVRSLWTHSRGPLAHVLAQTQIEENKTRHGPTSLWPNTYAGFQRAWPLCVGLLGRKGKSLIGSTLPGWLLTSRLALHNRPSCPHRPCSACAACYPQGVSEPGPMGMCPSRILSFPSVH